MVLTLGFLAAVMTRVTQPLTNLRQNMQVHLSHGKRKLAHSFISSDLGRRRRENGSAARDAFKSKVDSTCRRFVRATPDTNMKCRPVPCSRWPDNFDIAKSLYLTREPVWPESRFEACSRPATGIATWNRAVLVALDELRAALRHKAKPGR